ncbi:MAG: stage III sporulation protein AB [Oscillospiraceae bacterium]|nr:stage III sporulation protein AB [Oscillospiraceae bacterium]
MPVRYIGAAIVFLSCGGFGFLKAAHFRREERLLAELIRLLEQMQSELEFRLTPLPMICEHAAQEAAGSLKAVFSALAAELEAQVAPDASACMQAALKRVADLPKNLQKALTMLGNSLGRFDLQGQMNELCAVREFCASHYGRMQENRDARLRSYQSLGLCVGAGLAILFL